MGSQRCISVERFNLSERGKAILTLSLLSPVLAELLSGSSPPLEFFNPVSFLFLWGFYGAGVLIVHELWVRWGGGYMRLMLLGFAYGIFEEGLAIKSWFDPGWMDLGVFATYGRIWGINSMWAVWLTVFHSVMSISAPIIVFGAYFPGYREKSLLSDREMKKAFYIFMIMTFLSYFGLNPYAPPTLQYLLAGLLMICILRAAMKRDMKPVFRPFFAPEHPFIYGAIVSTLLFIINTAFPKAAIPVIITMAADLLVILHFYSQMEQLDDRGRYAQIFGFLSFWAIFMGIIYEIMGVTGMSVVGLSTFLILFKKYTEIQKKHEFLITKSGLFR